MLDTGGGIKKAAPFFQGNEPFLIHNVDILSDTDLKALYESHLHSGNDATLLASKRTTARYLLFDKQAYLRGWVNKDTGQTKPEGFEYDATKYQEYAFSGIHVISLPFSDTWTNGGKANSPSWISICKHVGKPELVDV